MKLDAGFCYRANEHSVGNFLFACTTIRPSLTLVHGSFPRSNTTNLDVRYLVYEVKATDFTEIMMKIYKDGIKRTNNNL
jgi:hypothetical protein